MRFHEWALECDLPLLLSDTRQTETVFALEVNEGSRSELQMYFWFLSAVYWADKEKIALCVRM